MIEPNPSASGAELVAEYELLDLTTKPAGVAYTHPTMGYQAVTLGFGMEYMSGDMMPNGHFESGVQQRVALLDTIMRYFGKEPTGAATGADDPITGVSFSHAHPNPFGPATRIDYGVVEAGPMTIRIYDLSGRVVRTLLDRLQSAGTSGHVIWDGRNDRGEKCSSGVYFSRLVCGGQARTNRLVLLR